MGKNREQTNLEKNWLCAVDLSAFERTLKELIVSLVAQRASQIVTVSEWPALFPWRHLVAGVATNDSVIALAFCWCRRVDQHDTLCCCPLTCD